jgi:membrane protease YdiL (CAAX protease family)
VFGLLAERSGSLVAPMLAHLAINETGAVAALAVQRAGNNRR